MTKERAKPLPSRLSSDIKWLDGALESNFLEHFDSEDLFEKLEEWERYFQSDRELVRALLSLDDKGSEDASSDGLHELRHQTKRVTTTKV
jgi:hypothetical protein